MPYFPLFLCSMPSLLQRARALRSPSNRHFLVGTLLACGIGAILQSGFPKFSSGLLIVPMANVVAISFAIQAGLDAGPAGIATLAVFGGMIEIFAGRLLKYLRPYLPPEVCGVVVLVLGMSMVPAAFNRILGFNAQAAVQVIDHSAMTIGLVTLISIAASSIWLKGTMRLFSMLIGCTIGYAVAGAFGHFDQISEVVASGVTRGLAASDISIF
jgi:xanthine permease XanP